MMMKMVRLSERALWQRNIFPKVNGDEWKIVPAERVVMACAK